VEAEPELRNVDGRNGMEKYTERTGMEKYYDRTGMEKYNDRTGMEKHNNRKEKQILQWKEEYGCRAEMKK